MRRFSRRPLRSPAVKVPFTPSHLSGCHLWLDSIDTNYLYQDLTPPGSTLANANNDPVGVIRDRSAGENHFAALTNSNRALVEISSLKGKLVFDGTNDFYVGPQIANLSGACTIALSWSLRSVLPSSSALSIFTIQLGTTAWTEFVVLNYSGYEEICWSCGFSTSPIGVMGCGGGLNTNLHRAVITFDGVNNTFPSSYTMLLDGAAQTVNYSGGTVGTAGTTSSLGGRWNGSSFSTTGPLDFRCLAMWSGVKTAEEIQRIDTWLATHP